LELVEGILCGREGSLEVAILPLDIELFRPQRFELPIPLGKLGQQNSVIPIEKAFRKDKR